MEDVIQVLVFIAIITSVLIGKYKEVHANRPGKHVPQPLNRNTDQFSDNEELDDEIRYAEELDDEEPDDEELNIEELDEEEFNPKEFNQEKFDRVEFDGKEQDGEKPIDSLETQFKIEPNQETKSPTPQPQKEPRIRLRTRKEARRAFIYSEIFNRKYE